MEPLINTITAVLALITVSIWALVGIVLLWRIMHHREPGPCRCGCAAVIELSDAPTQ